VTRRVALLAGALVLLAGACGQGQTAQDSGPPLIVQQSDNPAIPYGITAINYHFHDAHPSLPLLPTRTVRFLNEGSVKHNVTIPDLGYSRDIHVNDVIQIKDLGRKLGGPGTYTFFCKYHEAMGMVGTIVISGG
jgi:hypothetical protein